MSEQMILVIVLAVAAVFFPGILIRSQRIDRLQTLYLCHLKAKHPEIGIGKKRGIVQCIEIDGSSYPSSVADFYKDYRSNPHRIEEIIDMYIVSVPARFSKKKAAG